MNNKISVSKLKNNLKLLEPKPIRSSHLSKGALYLHDALYQKLLGGQPVRFGDLDFTQFCLSDIQDMSDYYKDIESDVYTLSKVCDGLQSSPVRLRPVSFV